MKRENELDSILHDYAETEAQYQNSLKVLELLKNFIETMERFPERSKQSEMDKKLLLFKELVWLSEMEQVSGQEDFLKKHTSDLEIEAMVEVHEEDYEQLALPGFPSERGTVRWEKKKVSVNLFKRNRCYKKVAPDRTQAEILADHHKKWLLDCHRYFETGISVNTAKNVLASELEKWILKYPLQLLLVLPRPGIRLLRKLADAKEGASLSITENNVDDYLEMLVWGLLDASIIYQNEEICFGFSVPVSVKDKILPCMEMITRETMEQSDIWCYFSLNGDKISDQKEVWSGIEMFGDKLQLLLDYYGVLDAETFYRLFVETYQEKLTQKQLLRFVYLWGTFHKRLITGKTGVSKERFVARSDLNVGAVFQKREEYCKNIPFQSHQEEVLSAELQQVMGLWAETGTFFERWEIDQEEIREIMLEGHSMVKEGLAVADLMDYLMEQFEIEFQTDFAMLWRRLVWIGLCTPLPMLMGHSRNSFQAEYGRYQYLDLFAETKKRVRKAALYELPVKIQEQLANLVILAETSDLETLKAAETEVSLSCGQNEQVKFFLVVNRLSAYGNIRKEEERDAAAEEMRKMILNLCEECRNQADSSVLLRLAAGYGLFQIEEDHYAEESFRDSFWDDEREETMAPVVKMEKVYPNDPCPCGSGKKFKKCCKGKGVYD